MPDDPQTVEIPSEDADRFVEAACGGDADAFSALFRATVNIVFGHVYGRCGDRSLAEDLTSDTYVRALRAIGRFEGGSRDFLAWVLTIARNLHLDHVKSGRVRWETVVEEMPVEHSTSDPESEAIARVGARELRLALGRLTADQQEVVYLRFLRGLPVAEVAAIVGRNEGAVKALQFRALRSLARILDETGAVGDES